MMKYVMLATCLSIVSLIGSATGTPNLDGVWRSDGYGFLLEIKGGTARLFSIGADHCLPEGSAMAPLGHVLPGSDFAVSGDRLRLTIGFPMEPHRISANRLASLPGQCAVHESADAIGVFDAFVSSFEANYPFFAFHDVDWFSRVAEARRRVNSTTEDQVLFDALAWLMAPIRDGHVALIADIDGSPQISAPGRARILQYLRDTACAERRDPSSAVRDFRRAVWYESIRLDILRDQGQMLGNDHIQYGMLTHGVGYLAFRTLDGFGPDDPTPKENLTVTQNLMDLIITDLSALGAASLVLDLSLNFGGSDYIARELASRFLQEEVLAYSKYAADAAQPIMTNIRIKQSPNVRFDGDVFLLTSHITISAAEVLTLSLLTQPHVTHVGEITRGALSDALSQTLPNGWQLNLPNEVYLDAKGQHWEGVGIPPEVEFPVLSDADPIASHRDAIFRLLRAKTSN